MILRFAAKLFGGVLLFLLGLTLVFLACSTDGCNGVSSIYKYLLHSMIATEEQGSGTTIPLETEKDGTVK
ncbi:hypothetical protein COU78_06755 [Candidatus Peregrinibacteria bacterium CG10_big_fil_rev_8_21_14_0_10_49_24]|nr:MAG: hypothetical protein COV83_02050 [Candidatus Peregrinibacteria bacterium CG11_big_fil_rev_8_21_14_0_20_49_14]PIR50389.1 MAG: hypothetical protein COU78_06755 [Candidatus Peregrinibacteria bacterium CG10_big_fil_rev_8_21_14_0_10_49_24]PJA67478.1 MAG: hypothetical protein CO157_03545 [Candidatus Peregrinibacteria bacterium CG_4_9_14_3_um_filter_49_12]